MIKFLCIADIHGDIQYVLRAREFAVIEDIENVILLGDFSGHGAFRNPKKNGEDVRKVLSILSNFNILAIPGNCDSKGVLKIFDKHEVNLHRKSVVLDNTVLVGLGGSNSTPFDTPFELPEEKIYEGLKSLLRMDEKRKVILVLHCPPKDTECDRSGKGAHVGSEAIREIVEEFQPRLVLCSHVHESAGKEDKVRKSRIVNIGPVSNGKVGILSTGGRISFKLVDI